MVERAERVGDGEGEGGIGEVFGGWEEGGGLCFVDEFG